VIGDPGLAATALRGSERRLRLQLGVVRSVGVRPAAAIATSRSSSVS
jgi:hypothetical protein